VPNRPSAWVLLVALLLGLCRPLCACHASQATAGCHVVAAESTSGGDGCCADEERAAEGAPARSEDGCCCAHASEPRQKSPETLGSIGALAWLEGGMLAVVVGDAPVRARRLLPARRESLPTPPLLALHCRLLI